MNHLDFVCIDVETTGLSIKENELIEVGLVKYKDGDLIAEYSEIIKPLGRISDYVVNMTGISNQMVSEAKPFEDLADDIVAFIGESLILGHNVPFDVGMLNSSLDRLAKPTVDNDTIDTLDLIAILMPTHRSYKLSHLAKLFEISEPNVHRAKDDALMTSNLYLKLVEMASELDNDSANFLYYYVTLINWKFADILRSIFADKLKNEEFPWILLFSKKVNEIKNHKRNLAEGNEFKNVDIETIFDLFKKDGPISKKLKNYEVRTAQIEMIEETWQTLEESKHTIIEAGTGIGKTFAYTIPSMYYALKHNERVVISTKTKNLQEQIIDKDIPFIKKTLGIDFQSEMIKGRNNYVCINKLAYLFTRIIDDQQYDDMKSMLAVMMWLFKSNYGDFTEVHNSLVTKFKNQISSDSYSCLQSKCPFKTICFINRIKKRSKDAQIIVVNHALLFSDIFYTANIIPNYDHLIIDEAHTVENIATGCFSRGINKKRIHDVAVKIIEQKILADHVLEESTLKLKFAELQIKGRTLLNKNIELFKHVEEIFKKKEKENIFYKKSKKKLSVDQLLDEDLATLEEFLSVINGIITDLENMLLEQSDYLKQNLDKIQFAFFKKILLEVVYIKNDVEYLKLKMKNYVRWLEKTEYRKTKIFELKAVPIDVGSSLQKYIFKDKQSVLLTSATLSVKSNFNYFLSRIGYLDNDIKVNTHILNSPFDLEKNILMCIPQDSPQYVDDKQYLEKLAKYIERIIISTEGKALILFTSHKHMSEVYYLLKEPMMNYKIQLLVQGKNMSDRNLIKAFKQNVDSVLMGTDSFWEGVDVPGEALSHVVIVKLPFEVPTDPIVMARMESVASTGKSSFFEYVIPNAVVKFKQGFGRLIRNKSDRGSVIILDKRVLTQGYGKRFLDSVIANKKFPKNIKELAELLVTWD